MKPIIDPLISEERIQERVLGLAREIAPHLSDDTVMLGLLTGALVFTADLARALAVKNCPLCLDFMVLSSYGSGTQSSGSITTRMDCLTDLTGRTVLLVDDILDTGITLSFAKQRIIDKGAAKILTCVLLNKPARRKIPVEVEFIGFEVPDLFVVGYGIDYNQQYRELPYVGTVRFS